MKTIKTILCIAAMLCCISVAQAKKVNENEPQSVYVYGVSFSLNDSIVYFTSVQKLDSVYLKGKFNYLRGRAGYANQLRSFFKNKLNRDNTTNVVMSDVDKVKLEKRFLKMKNHFTYIGKGKKQRLSGYDIRYLAESEFQFELIDFSEDVAEEMAAAKARAQERALKKKAKAEKKNKKKSVPQVEPK